MKKYLAIVSSIITTLVFVLGEIISRSADNNAQMTYEGEANLITKVFILLVVGIVVGWNIWVFYKNSNPVSTVIISIVLNIIVVLIYFFILHRDFILPIILIGIYTFLLVNSLCSKNKTNE